MSAPGSSSGAQGNDAMEVEDNNQGSKRKLKLVDPDTGNEVSDPKKPRVEPNVSLKKKVLRFIVMAADSLFSSIAGIPAGARDNVNISQQVTNVLFTCHSILRQKQSGITGNMETKSTGKDFSIKYLNADYVLKRDKALKDVELAAITAGLTYMKFKEGDENNWYGMAGPYLNFFVGFGLRMTELRVGHGMMPTKKAGETVEGVSVYKYGLYGCHHVLLEGVTFPPEKRSSMVQSLGPMTAMLCYIRSTGKYADKYKTACKRSMSHIPMIDDILAVVQGKKAYEVAPLLSNLADILCITTSRQAQRAFFPLLPFCKVMARKTVGEDGKITYNFEEALLENFSSAGAGAFLTYKKMCEKGRYEMMGTMTDKQAAQMVYHCIFGTYKEDMSILSKITDFGSWETRESLGKAFQRAATSGKAVSFKLIDQILYSKLCSANQTGLLSSTYQQTLAVPVFSGRRTLKFDDDFFETIAKRMGKHVGGKTIESLVQSTSALLKEMEEILEENGRKLDCGTVRWRKVEDLSLTQVGTAIEDRLVGENKFFLGKNGNV